MIESAVQAALWQKSVVERIVQQTPAIKSFSLRLGNPFTHVAGQHVDVRLTAPDGYMAMRSYSIASPPDGSGNVELAIERLPDGEVSPLVPDVAAVGDEIELRGPLGGHFLWPQDAAGPVFLIGAGSGLVPLMAMIRQRRVEAQNVPTALLLSARTARDVLYAKELQAIEFDDPGFVLSLAITREAPTRETDFARRIDGAMVQEVITRLPRTPAHVFVCGSNGFVNIATDGALFAGLDAATIKTERYGG